MGRIVCIDYGMKRCGIAATDALQIAVHPVATVERSELLNFLRDYFQNESIEKLVFGHPEKHSGRQTPMVQSMMDTVALIRKDWPELNIDFHEEDFSSQEAAIQLVRAGVKKKQRKTKGTLDRMSAMIILQDYLGHF